jgi:integrase
MSEEPTVEARPKRAYGEGRVFYRADRGCWFIAYCHNGKEIREKAGVDKAAARQLLKRKLREKERETFIGPGERRVTVAELLDARETYLANRGAKSPSTGYHIAVIRKHFGLDKAVGIGAERLERFVAEERMLGKQPATINRELEQLRAAYGLAVKQKRLNRSVVPFFPMQNERNNVRKGYFEPEEFALFVVHLPPAVADVTRFAYLTGWRKSEIVTLTWEQIDRAAREVRLYDSKSGEGRIIALDADAWGLIERRWQARSYTKRKTKQTHLSPLVFHRNGRRIRDFRKVWAKALEKAGLPTGDGAKLFHDFRRTAARDMVRAGVPQSVAMSITGHKTVSMFLRYKITSGEEQREALTRTAALRQQRAAEAASKPKVAALRSGEQ